MQYFRAHRRSTAASKGFTLMELLVVMSLFTTIMLIASDIFLLSNRASRKVFGLERTQADARYTMEAITREVRTGQVDFAYYAGRTAPLSTPDGELALIESDNTPIKFRVSTSAESNLCADANSSPCLLVTVGAGSPAAVTPKNVAVSSAKFYVAPSVDPTVFNTGTGAYNSDVQPRVTVVLVLQSKGAKAAEQSVVYLQTTAASRSYKR
jgi:prepilin-type N-terminal cleavage/methylation domain-containing protein